MTDQPDSDSPPVQPAESAIQFLSSGDTLTFMIPRTGFRGVAMFFLIFAAIWDSITFIVAGVFLVGFFQHPSFEDFLVLAFLSLFVFIGIAVALAAIQTAFRKAVILATRDSLVYTQQGPIRNVEFQWKPEDLASIRADYSGTKINERRLRELQIKDQAGNKRGFMDGREDAELEWLAYTLRVFYGKQDRNEEITQNDGDPAPPTQSV